MTDTRTTHRLLLPPAARPTRTAPRPNLLTAAGRCDAGAVMRLAHELARDDVADAARRGRTRRYKVALRDALPILTAIINTPTLRPDGSLLDAPGYDEATGLFFDPRGVAFPKIPDSPTRRDAERALADLSELLGGFPFVAEASVALSGSPDDTNRRNAGVAALALHAFAPQDPVEAMIASQAVVLHFAALECARRAMVPQQSPDVSSKLRKDAANLSRSMVEMCEALDRRRGKGGQQRIVVERVVVNEGGQAVVAGSVVGGGALPASPPAPPAIGQGTAPMARLDAEPVETGVGWGERGAGSDG